MIGHWITFGVLFLFIPVGFAYWGVLCTKKHNPTEQQKKNMNVTLGKCYAFILVVRFVIYGNI